MRRLRQLRKRLIEGRSGHSRPGSVFRYGYPSDIGFICAVDRGEEDDDLPGRRRPLVLGDPEVILHQRGRPGSVGLRQNEPRPANGIACALSDRAELISQPGSVRGEPEPVGSDAPP